MRYRPVLAALWVAALSSAALAAEPAAADLLRDTGLSAGLLVHVGTSDGRLEAELAGSGNILVHGLAADQATVDAARKTIAAKGLGGIATVERAADFATLPYADNLVNVLVADLDALGAKAPGQAEMMRVLTPGSGVAYLKRGSGWTKTVKPRPKEMDDWTHFDHGADGNGISHDTLVKTPTQLQWISAVQQTKMGGNPAAYHVVTGMRAAGGRVFYAWYSGMPKGGKPEYYYTAHDAFNGVPLWNIKSAVAGRNDWAFVADAAKLYTFIEKGKPPVAIDAATGRVLFSFDKAPAMNDDSGRTCLRLTASTLLVACGSTMAACDPATGALRWSTSENGADLLFPTISPDGKHVFALVSVVGAKDRIANRWPGAKAEAVVCLDAATGKPLWRNTEVKGQVIGQLIASGSSLALFGPVGIGAPGKEIAPAPGQKGNKAGYTGCIDIAANKLLWQKDIIGGGQYNQTWGLNMVVRNNTMFYATPWNLFEVNLKSGEKTLFWGSGYNQRCNRFAATDDVFVMGLGTVITRDGAANVHSISRGGCAQGTALANGMHYFTPNVCGCITEIRGHLALSSEPVRKPVPVGQRLETGGPAVTITAGGTTPATPLTREWDYYALGGKTETEPAVVGSNTLLDNLVAVIHQHRLERRDPFGQVRWSFTAGGRITSAPVVLGDKAFFGSHDGYVYAVKVSDGALAWRFLAAPYQRKLVANGQVESAWPVFGVVVHEGKIAASAGLHPETGGGIYVWSLEPATGEVAWAKTITRLPVALEAGPGRKAVVPNRIINDVLKSDGHELVLPGIRFSPSEPDAAIQAKVDNPEKK